ncbi:EamA family transporter [Thermopolyspora sp. NPDC052614]|uniref:EamA family transporter n=1 Tax=Thermopolyspora sp. NPDC052614 TaxID=3155682 RepID=UPI003442E135
MILGAAVAHAGWNLFSKQAAAADGVVFLWLVALCSVVVWTPLAILFGSAPTWGQFLAMLASALLHLGYFVVLQRGYRHGDLSLVYPLARGTGPMLSSVGAVPLLGERPTPQEIAGIALIGLGIFALGLPRGGATRAGVAAFGFGVGTGLFIAAYTLWDAWAVKSLAVSPLVFNAVAEWGRVLPMAPWGLSRRALIGPLWRAHRWRIIGTAVLSPLSYLLVLTALEIAPVTSVAPMREVSVLIGVILGGRLLAEGDLHRRLAASAVIVGGVCAIALA